MFNFKTVSDVELFGKTVFVRTDFNTLLNDKGEVINDYRIRKSLPTIKFILRSGASKIIIGSHLGNPKGIRRSEFSLRPARNRFAELMGIKPANIPILGDRLSEATIADILDSPRSIVFLENLHFDPEEELNTFGYCSILAKLADVYVNDALGASRRNNSSVAGVSRFKEIIAGLLLTSEIDALYKIKNYMPKPIVAIVGGYQLEEKIDAVEILAEMGAFTLLGAAVSSTFFASSGNNADRRFILSGKKEFCQGLLKRFNCKELRKIILPIDFCLWPEKGKPNRQECISRLSYSAQVSDLGNFTVLEYSRIIASAGTIIWLGPVGFYDFPFGKFATETLARAFAGSTAKVKVIGGRRTTDAVERAGLIDTANYVLPGSSLIAFLKNNTLPGIEALANK